MWSATVQSLITNPGPCGPLKGCTHYGSFGVSGEGPYFLLWLRVSSRCIEAVSFDTYGCVAALATGTLLARILVGRTLEQACEVTSKDLDLLLGGLPEGKGAVLVMAIEALAEAARYRASTT